jgi:hypothetical protein
VVLAELTGGVAEIVQELGERRCSWLQERRAARQLRRDHACAERRHAGEEGIAPGRAALLGVIRGEHRTLTPDAVDVGCLSQPQSTLVEPDLHPADVIAHDEKDIWLLGRLACRRCGGDTQGSRRCK